MSENKSKEVQEYLQNLSTEEWIKLRDKIQQEKRFKAEFKSKVRAIFQIAFIFGVQDSIVFSDKDGEEFSPLCFPVVVPNYQLSTGRGASNNFIDILLRDFAVSGANVVYSYYGDCGELRLEIKNTKLSSFTSIPMSLRFTDLQIHQLHHLSVNLYQYGRKQDESFLVSSEKAWNEREAFYLQKAKDFDFTMEGIWEMP